MTSSQAVPPPWVKGQQKQSKKELIQQLKRTKAKEQASLTQELRDNLEIEFSKVVEPVMESCTKDSISVSGWREGCWFYSLFVV